MFKIVQKDGNDKVIVQVNGMETDYKFDKEYDLDTNIQQILTDAGFQLEEIKEQQQETQQQQENGEV